jgi:hypothetical protein
MEIWKDVEGYEGLYQVSSEGRVKSLERSILSKSGSIRIKKEKILSQSKQRYCSVTLSDNCKKIYPLVHRLLGKAFIPNIHNYPLVMHIDNDGTNNNVQNLKWGTYSDNNQQAWDDGNQEYSREYNSNRLKQLHKNKDKIFKNYA